MTPLTTSLYSFNNLGHHMPLRKISIVKVISRQYANMGKDSCTRVNSLQVDRKKCLASNWNSNTHQTCMPDKPQYRAMYDVAAKIGQQNKISVHHGKLA